MYVYTSSAIYLPRLPLRKGDPGMFFVLMFIDINHGIDYLFWILGFLGSRLSIKTQRFSSKEFCPETCGHGQAIYVWYYCNCRFITPSAKHPLFLCFTATDCISKGKKSKMIRAWRLSGSRTTLLSTLFSNDWLGPGTVWTFYYFDAIFLLLQGSRIDGVDKWSKMPNLRLLSSSWRGTSRDRPSVHYTFHKTQLGFVLDGSQSFGKSFQKSSPRWISSFTFVKEMATSMHGSNGHENTMFFLYFKILNSWFPSWIRTMWMRNRMWSAASLLLLAQKSSTLWIRFWNMKRAVQCARRNEWFMQLLFVMELASLWVLYWPTPCFSVIVMQQLLCPIFCKSQGFGNLCPWLNTALCWRPCFTSSIAFELLLDDEKTSVSWRMSENELLSHWKLLVLRISVICCQVCLRRGEGAVDLWNRSSQISNAFVRTAVMMMKKLQTCMIEIFRAGFCLMCDFFSDMQGVTKNEQNHQHHHNIVIEKFWIHLKYCQVLLILMFLWHAGRAVQCSVLEGVSCCKMSQCCAVELYFWQGSCNMMSQWPIQVFLLQPSALHDSISFWSHVEWQSLCFIQ